MSQIDLKLTSESGEKSGRRHIDVLPVSVVEVAAANQRRDLGGHDMDSSRGQHSNFFPEVCDLVYQLHLHDSKLIYDPFAGWGERADGAKRNGKEYYGIDINPAAIYGAAHVYGASNTLASAQNHKPPEGWDALFTCPPYWNLEKYTDNPCALETAQSWKEFLDRLSSIFFDLYWMAPVGAKFCIACGDWRMKKQFYDLSFEIQSMFSRVGAAVIDKVVISRRTISKIKIMIPQAVEQGYTVKVHEYLLVFQKQKANP